jgi:hypothetical protein
MLAMRGGIKQNEFQCPIGAPSALLIEGRSLVELLILYHLPDPANLLRTALDHLQELRRQRINSTPTLTSTINDNNHHHCSNTNTINTNESNHEDSSVTATDNDRSSGSVRKRKNSIRDAIWGPDANDDNIALDADIHIAKHNKRSYSPLTPTSPTSTTTTIISPSKRPRYSHPKRKKRDERDEDYHDAPNKLTSKYGHGKRNNGNGPNSKDKDKDSKMVIKKCAAKASTKSNGKSKTCSSKSPSTAASSKKVVPSKKSGSTAQGSKGTKRAKAISKPTANATGGSLPKHVSTIPLTSSSSSLTCKPTMSSGFGIGIVNPRTIPSSIPLRLSLLPPEWPIRRYDHQTSLPFPSLPSSSYQAIGMNDYHTNVLNHRDGGIEDHDDEDYGDDMESEEIVDACSTYLQLQRHGDDVDIAIGDRYGDTPVSTLSMSSNGYRDNGDDIDDDDEVDPSIIAGWDLVVEEAKVNSSIISTNRNCPKAVTSASSICFVATTRAITSASPSTAMVRLAAPSISHLTVPHHALGMGLNSMRMTTRIRSPMKQPLYDPILLTSFVRC